MTQDIFLPIEYQLPAGIKGLRLDAALRLIFPELGLRGVRRLWTWCNVLVNGHARSEGYAVRAGDLIRIEAHATLQDTESKFVEQKLMPYIVHIQLPFVVFFKPAGMHSAAIAGGREASLEKYVHDHLGNLLERYGLGYGIDNLLPVPQLLSRLDRDTSGLVLGAFSSEAGSAFRQLEMSGKVRKIYLALVHGRVEGTLYLTGNLDTDNRKVTRVLSELSLDNTRHTLADPIAYQDGFTLLRVEIQRGARHQIRAHLAAAGFPIVGDSLYGADYMAETAFKSVELQGVIKEACLITEPYTVILGEANLYLHHAALFFADFSAYSLPTWIDDTAGIILNRVIPA